MAARKKRSPKRDSELIKKLRNPPKEPRTHKGAIKVETEKCAACSAPAAVRIVASMLDGKALFGGDVPEQILLCRGCLKEAAIALGLRFLGPIAGRIFKAVISKAGP